MRHAGQRASKELDPNLSKGLNILNGRNAVGYLRFRKDGLGDIGRTQRQQWFLKEFMEKLKTPQAIAKIPDMLDAVTSYVKTDMSFYEISQFAALAKGIDVDKIEFATLPGAPNKKGYISYWILDPDKTQEMINRMIYRDNVKDNDASVDALRTALEEAVKRQMMSDVPYGVLLSGGLDSSIIAAVTAKFAKNRIESGDAEAAWWPRLHSFAIGLEGSPDLIAAKKAADFIGTVHHEVHFTIQEALL